MYQQLDAQTAPPSADPLTPDLRHHAAAYATAAAAVGIDVIVTDAPTAGRCEVADNDVVASVSPDDAVALVGHYLRVTENPIVDVQRGALHGGGSWEMTESTATTANFYDWGVVSAMTYFDCFPFIATREGDSETVNALKSIRLRLARAARALDRMLAALSNQVTGKRRPDVIETAAEAFDRELLYLAAAFDIYGRRFPLLIGPTRDPLRFRQSLDGRGYLTDHVNREYDPSVLTDVARLHVYAGRLQSSPQPHPRRHPARRSASGTQLRQLSQRRSQSRRHARARARSRQRDGPGACVSGADLSLGVGHVLATDAVVVDTDSQGIGVQWSENSNADDFSKNLIRARCEAGSGPRCSARWASSPAA